MIHGVQSEKYHITSGVLQGTALAVNGIILFLLRKWCYTPLQHDFALDPIIPPFDFHFRIYTRDLAILTE
jgi:hypothetical protein